MAGAAEVLVGALGGVPYEGGPGPGYTGAQWRFEAGARLEVIEPAGDDGFLHRFLRARGPGIHHVTFIVPDIAEAARSATAMGYDVVGYNDSFPSWKECFLHPKQALGIVVQMAQKSDGGENTWGPEFPFPSARARRRPVRIAALCLNAHAPGAAHRQWGELLGGELVEGSGSRVVYRWPESPILIAVDLDESRSVGPTSIEVSDDEALVLPLEPFPPLGARFIQVT